MVFYFVQGENDCFSSGTNRIHHCRSRTNEEVREGAWVEHNGQEKRERGLHLGYRKYLFSLTIFLFTYDNLPKTNHWYIYLPNTHYIYLF